MGLDRSQPQSMSRSADKMVRNLGRYFKCGESLGLAVSQFELGTFWLIKNHLKGLKEV